MNAAAHGAPSSPVGGETRKPVCSARRHPLLQQGLDKQALSVTSVSLLHAPARKSCTSLLQLISIVTGLGRSVYFPSCFATLCPVLYSLQLASPFFGGEHNVFILPLFIRYRLRQARPSWPWGRLCFFALETRPAKPVPSSSVQGSDPGPLFFPSLRAEREGRATERA